ncbi:LOW QUALITY PROTEIN: hypothetical protein YC2023_067015 [Brassica napus]
MKKFFEDLPKHVRQDAVDTNFSDANKRAECVHGNRKRSNLSILRLMGKEEGVKDTPASNLKPTNQCRTLLPMRVLQVFLMLVVLALGISVHAHDQVLEGSNFSTYHIYLYE